MNKINQVPGYKYLYKRKDLGKVYLIPELILFLIQN